MSVTPPRPRLLSGGNPQIPKGEGRAPIEAYLDALPDWKAPMGRQIDALIRDVVPDAHMAVKWNTPFYGRKDEGWFAAFHCLKGYIKITFFQGDHLSPPPPEPSKQPDVRYLHVSPDTPLDPVQFRDWIGQAQTLPMTKL